MLQNLGTQGPRGTPAHRQFEVSLSRHFYFGLKFLINTRVYKPKEEMDMPK